MQFLAIIFAYLNIQTVWIQIRTDILSVLIWIKTVCKRYQETTKFARSMEGVKYQRRPEWNVKKEFILSGVTVCQSSCLPLSRIKTVERWKPVIHSIAGTNHLIKFLFVCPMKDAFFQMHSDLSTFFPLFIISEPDVCSSSVIL